MRKSPANQRKAKQKENVQINSEEQKSKKTQDRDVEHRQSEEQNKEDKTHIGEEKNAIPQNDNNSGNNNSNSKEIKQSIIFGRVALGAVITCLIGMLICFTTFLYNTYISTEEYMRVIKIIESNTVQTPAVDTSSRPIAVLSESADPLTSASSDDSLSNTSSDNNDNDKLATLITHMENMIAIQKSGMTNDLMSFIYGILSTTLIGVCIKIVTQCRASADEAQKTADEAQKNADRVNESVNAMNKAISRAQNAATIAKKLQFQLKLLIIADWIMSAKTALLRLDYHAANVPIIKIRDETPLLFSDEEFKGMMESFAEDSMGIGKVYNDLLCLKDNVKDFLAESKQKYNTGSELKTREDAAENYQRWIQKALDCIDDASDEMENPARYR